MLICCKPDREDLKVVEGLINIRNSVELHALDDAGMTHSRAVGSGEESPLLTMMTIPDR